MSQLPPLADAVVPSGIRSRFVSDINALRMHVLEAGFEERGRPLALLLHGSQSSPIPGERSWFRSPRRASTS
jgi:hypothetical protein